MSIWRSAGRLGAWAVMTLGMLSSCSPSVAPVRVRYQDVGSSGQLARYTGQGALIIEFQKGDRIPVQLAFHSESFQVEPEAPPLTLVAKERCFVRFDRDGIRTSLDGENFDRKPAAPGSFQVAFHAQRHQAPKLNVVVVTPKLAR